MAVPAFDMEPGSTSAPPEPPASPQPELAKPASGEATAGKRPLASLASIAAKNKPAGPSKAGDLTRFFELAHRQTMTLAEPPSIPALVPVSVVPPVRESQPEAAPSAIVPTEAAVAEVPSELEAAPEPTRAEAPAEIEPTIVSEVPLEAPEPLAGMFAPVEETSPPVEIAEPAPEAVEPPPATLGSVLDIEAAGLRAPEPPADSTPPATIAPVEPQQTPAPKFTELADYWRSLRVGDDHPAAQFVDHDLVTELWPGSLLISYTPASQDPRGELRPGRVTRLGTCCRETQNAVDAGSHSTEWMLEVARTALINDEPLEEQQRLATLTGDEGFRMVALPLGPPKGLANAVLCTLLPSPGAPRFGKRRTWL